MIGPAGAMWSRLARTEPGSFAPWGRQNMSLGKSKTQNLQLSQDPDRSNSYVSVDCRAADRQTRIIIISDARLYREGLAVSLSTIYRLVVVGLASTLAEAL